jgi:hypothetical protein
MMQYIQKRMRINLLIISSLVAVLILIMIFAKPVHAAEITPDPSTYVYGSTSEFSPYVTLTSSGSLAPTGESQFILVLLAITAIASGVAVLYVATRLYRQ